jgi:hypothetical protein
MGGQLSQMIYHSVSDNIFSYGGKNQVGSVRTKVCHEVLCVKLERLLYQTMSGNLKLWQIGERPVFERKYRRMLKTIISFDEFRYRAESLQTFEVLR